MYFGELPSEMPVSPVLPFCSAFLGTTTWCMIFQLHFFLYLSQCWGPAASYGHLHGHGSQYGPGDAHHHRTEQAGPRHCSFNFRRGPQKKGDVCWCFTSAQVGRRSGTSFLVSPKCCCLLDRHRKPSLAGSTRGSIPSVQALAIQASKISESHL